MLIDIFNNEHQYCEEFESFCGQNCISQILAYYGVKHPRFFINSALGVTLSLSDKENPGYNLKFDQKMMASDGPGKVIQNFSKERSAFEVWEENKAKINAGIPLVTGVDIFYLKYTPYFQKTHGNHRVILCGYSDIEENVMIIDYFRWVYKGQIGLQTFLESRGSQCPKDDGFFSGSPINNGWLEVERDGWQDTPEELIRKTVARSLEQFYHLNPSQQGNEYYGLAVLQKLLEMAVQHNGGDDMRTPEFWSDFRRSIYFLYSRLKVFKFYLKNATGIIDLELLTKAGEQVAEDLKLWELLLRITMKAILTKEKLLYAKVIKTYQAVIDLEAKRYDLLNRLNSALA